MILAEFEANEKRILDGIEEKGRGARETGLVTGPPDPGKTMMGYLIALRYGPDVVEPVTQFAERVQDAVGGRSVAYDGNTIHQTIVDYGLMTGVRGELEPDQKVLYGLIATAGEAFGARSLRPRTSFDRFIHSPDSVLLRPAENTGNYDLIEAVAGIAQGRGIDVRKAWGRHITVNRFTDAIPPGEMGAFNRTMDDDASHADISGARAQALDVGYFYMSREGFELTVTEQFKF